eukprot:m.291944 g.291944  ORF g.291944 m.291944 type:complete len:1016 (-) comp12539_c0_seq1:225-3272(-)
MVGAGQRLTVSLFLLLVLSCAFAAAQSPRPPPRSNSSTPADPAVIDLSEDQIAFARRLMDACDDNGGGSNCCSSRLVLSYVKGVAFVRDCFEAYQGIGCYEGLFNPNSTLRTKESRSQYELVPPGFFSPAGFDCLLGCTKGSYCPSYTTNLRFELPETEEAESLFFDCATRREANEGANVTTYCCSESRLPPFIPFGPRVDGEDFCVSATSIDFPCPAGFYCPLPTEKIECPAGSYCPIGSTAPRDCLFSSSCSAGTARQTFNPLGLLIAAAGVFVLAIALLRLLHKEHHRRNVLIPRAVESKTSIGGKTQEDAPLGHNFALGLRFAGVSARVKQRHILQNCTGVIRPGRLTAVMGNSGSGKSSLLNVLSGRAHYAKTTGELQLLGLPPNAAPNRSFFGYVPQEDIFHRHLTVFEILMYQAELRLPVGWAHDQKIRLVHEQLKLLRLDHIQHVVVGGEGDARSAISGGQARRLSMGMEMVSGPSLLFLDEPTSGLDAKASFDVMEALRRELKGGTLTAVAVIHQPRVEIFDMFDDLILMGEGGHLIYCGPAGAEAVAFIESMGHRMDPRANPADFIVDSLNVGTTHDDEGEDSELKEVLPRSSVDSSRRRSSSSNLSRPLSTSRLMHCAPAPGMESAESIEVLSGGEFDNSFAVEAIIEETALGVDCNPERPRTAHAQVDLSSHNKHRTPGGTLARSRVTHARSHAASRRGSSQSASPRASCSNLLQKEDSDISMVPATSEELAYIPLEHPSLFVELRIQITRSIALLLHNKLEVLVDHLYFLSACLLLGAITLAPEFINLPASYGMMCLITGAMGIAPFLRVFTRAERAYWREVACGVRPLPHLLAGMLVDQLRILTLALVGAGVLYSTYAPLVSWRIFFAMMWAFLFCIAGQAYFVSAAVSKSVNNITGIALIAIQVLLCGSAPDLATLDNIAVMGPVLYSISAGKWLVEGLILEERDASPDVLLYSYDELLTFWGFHRNHGAATSIIVLVAMGIAWRGLACVVFLWLRRSQL